MEERFAFVDQRNTRPSDHQPGSACLDRLLVFAERVRYHTKQLTLLKPGPRGTTARRIPRWGARTRWVERAMKGSCGNLRQAQVHAGPVNPFQVTQGIRAGFAKMAASSVLARSKEKYCRATS